MQASSSGNYIAEEAFKNSFMQQSQSSLKYRGNDELPIFSTIPVSPQSPSPTSVSSVKKRVKLKSVNTEKERKKIVGE